MPDALEDIVAAHESIALPEQKMQQVKDLPLDMTQFAGAPQFAPLDVERAIFKTVYKRGLRRPLPTPPRIAENRSGLKEK